MVEFIVTSHQMSETIDNQKQVAYRKNCQCNRALYAIYGQQTIRDCNYMGGDCNHLLSVWSPPKIN